MPDTPITDLDNLDKDGSYLRYHVARDNNVPGYAEHRSEVRSLCQLTKGSTVYEIGCGTGAHLPHFAERVGRGGIVVGVDASTKMLEEARARLERENGERERAIVTLVYGRLGEWRPEDKADVVLADRLIEHLLDPLEGLQQMKELCVPGGFVVVVNMLNAATVVNLGDGSRERTLARRVLAWRSERGTTSAWAAGVLPSLAVRAGLEPVRAETWSFPCGTIADTYPHTPLLEYGDHAHADGAVTKEDAAQWRELLEERERDGSFAACFAVRADVLRKPE